MKSVEDAARILSGDARAGDWGVAPVIARIRALVEQ